VDDAQETSVEWAYAVGDVTHGQNQTAIALGEGARAGVAIHKDLRRYPIRPDTGEWRGCRPGGRARGAGDLRARMGLVRYRTHHAGLRRPPPDR
jgi:thioredoxin reductase (NADPH)